VHDLWCSSLGASVGGFWQNEPTWRNKVFGPAPTDARQHKILGLDLLSARTKHEVDIVASAPDRHAVLCDTASLAVADDHDPIGLR
jgi:hypothetical protein